MAKHNSSSNDVYVLILNLPKGCSNHIYHSGKEFREERSTLEYRDSVFPKLIISALFGYRLMILGVQSQGVGAKTFPLPLRNMAVPVKHTPLVLGIRYQNRCWNTLQCSMTHITLTCLHLAG